MLLHRVAVGRRETTDHVGYIWNCSRKGKKEKKTGQQRWSKKESGVAPFHATADHPRYITQYIFLTKNWTGHWKFLSSRRQLADDEKEWRHLSAASRVIAVVRLSLAAHVIFGFWYDSFGWCYGISQSPAETIATNDSDLNSIFVGRPRVLA